MRGPGPSISNWVADRSEAALARAKKALNIAPTDIDNTNSGISTAESIVVASLGRLGANINRHDMHRRLLAQATGVVPATFFPLPGPPWFETLWGRRKIAQGCLDMSTGVTHIPHADMSVF